MSGARIIYVLLHKRTKQAARYSNGNLAVFASYELAERERPDWSTQFGTGKQILDIVPIAVAKDFKIYNKGEK